MDSSRSVPNFTDEDENLLATYFFQAIHPQDNQDNSGDNNNNAPLPAAASTKPVRERADKACSTLEGILLLIKVADRVELVCRQHSDALMQNILTNASKIQDRCAHLVRDDYFGCPNTFSDSMRNSLHVMVGSKAAECEPDENLMPRLMQHLRAVLASGRSKTVPPDFFTNELANILDEYHFASDTVESREVCLQLACRIDMDLQEQARLEEVIRHISHAINTTAVETIMKITTSIAVDKDIPESIPAAKSLLAKRDTYLQRFGRYTYGKALLAKLVTEAAEIKRDKHDLKIHELAIEIAELCSLALPDIFINKIKESTRRYQAWLEPESTASPVVKQHVVALMFMVKYYITDDFTKLAVLKTTRGPSPYALPLHFSGKLLRLLKENSLDKTHKAVYARCQKLAGEVDQLIFAVGKLHHLSKCAGLWLDYYHQHYTEIIAALFEKINDETAVFKTVTDLCFGLGSRTCRSFIAVIECYIAHGMQNLHQSNLEKAHQSYITHESLVRSGTINLRHKSRLLTLGKFANKNSEETQEPALPVMQIRNYEKLIRIIEAAVNAFESKNSQDETDTPHKQASAPTVEETENDNNIAPPGSPYFKHN
jgi:hypothetical protein